MIRVERGKGGAGPRHSSQPDAVGNPARVLALEKAQHLSVPQQRLKRGEEQPISDKTVWYACKQAARHAGLTNVSARIACGTASPRTCWKAGTDLRTIQILLGHGDLEDDGKLPASVAAASAGRRQSA